MISRNKERLLKVRGIPTTTKPHLLVNKRGVNPPFSIDDEDEGRKPEGLIQLSSIQSTQEIPTYPQMFRTGKVCGNSRTCWALARIPSVWFRHEKAHSRLA